jgi:hypothetical protein
MQTQRTEAVSDVAPESDDAAGGSSTREQPYVTV